MTGPVSAAEAYRNADVFCLPSIEEGFGLVVMEAMWKRTPVLGSTACGLRQQIRDGIDGVLVSDPNDEREVADALERMLAEPKTREDYARRAQRRVHAEFLIFTQLQRWLRVLAGVVEPGRRSLLPPPPEPPPPPSARSPHTIEED